MCFASPVATAVEVTWYAAIDRRTISYRSFRILTNAKTRGLHLQSERLTHLSTHLFFGSSPPVFSLHVVTSRVMSQK
jgi:hypothetical protein